MSQSRNDLPIKKKRVSFADNLEEVKEYKIEPREQALEPRQKKQTQEKQSHKKAKFTYTDSRYPLHVAAAKGNTALMIKLVNNGFSVNATDDQGYTPLHVAVLAVRETAVTLLMKYRACPLKKDQAGVSPFALAKAYTNKVKTKIFAMLDSAVNQEEERLRVQWRDLLLQFHKIRQQALVQPELMQMQAKLLELRNLLIDKALEMGTDNMLELKVRMESNNFSITTSSYTANKNVMWQLAEATDKHEDVNKLEPKL